MTTPAPRNRSALKNAWVMRWNFAADQAPTPRARNMYPIWLMVEYASTRLMSLCARALQPARSSVAAPIIATADWTIGASSNMTWVRAIRYTPAVTMVAAWIRALTGVGPAMASGNQTWSGSWADLPRAPPSKRAAARTAAPEPI